ncbi:hypothetical protein ACOMHN_043391 [Nucella lapillus]
MSVTTLSRVCLLVALLIVLQEGWSEAKPADLKNRLRIGAFNIQTFGKKKMGITAVAGHLKKIVERYDVLLIQEIRDKCEKSVRKLLDMLEPPFNFEISDRVGRTHTKEQYAFFYRTDRVLVLDKFMYNDTNDLFEREPFIVKIAPAFAKDDTVSLIALHSKPTDATAEIGHLKEVISTTLRKMGPDTEPIVLGDLNAGCTYANDAKRMKAKDYLTVHREAFTWLIGKDVDTTTKTSSDCAYDRIIVQAGKKSHAVHGTAQVFNFRKWLHLNESEAIAVSDHFPVEVELRFH